MKIISYISMILALLSEFMMRWNLVVVCSDYPKYGCSVKDSHLKPSIVPKSLVRHGIYLPFKYASDFIWMLGKNNFDSLVPVGCFRYLQAQIVAITHCSQRKPFNFVGELSARVY
jgi:hypothetical protein